MKMLSLNWMRRRATPSATPNALPDTRGWKTLSQEQLRSVAGGGVDPYPTLRIARPNMMVSPEL